MAVLPPSFGPDSAGTLNACAHGADNVGEMKLRAGARRQDPDATTTGSNEGGFTIIELLVAMSIFALFMTAAIGVLAGSLNITRNNRSRSVAANLAAQEMDTVRNADFADLTIGQVNSAQTVDGTPYTIQRDSEWITKTATSGPCDGASGSILAYLRVTVTVTWPVMNGVDPVQNQTVITPPVGSYDPNDGHIAVKVLDRDALPQSGVPVTINGPGGADTEVTTSDGCAFFAYLDPGSYTVSLSEVGYVDGQGVSGPSQTATVVATTTSSLQFQYDQASSLSVSLAGVSGGVIPSAAVSIGNTHLLPVGTKAFAGSGASRTISNLFPYADGYELWAGDCADADPQGLKSDGTAYYPGATRSTAIAVTPGSASSGSVTMSTLTVTVKRGTTAISGAAVKAVHGADAGCGSGETLTLGSTDATGTLVVAMPFGTWTLQVTGQSPATSWPITTLAPPAGAGSSLVSIR